MFSLLLLLLMMIFNFSSRSIWEANIDIIHKHNLEADLGLHSYTLGMNKYADLVSFHYFVDSTFILICVYI
jgi:hypothetical protein